MEGQPVGTGPSCAPRHARMTSEGRKLIAQHRSDHHPTPSLVSQLPCRGVAPPLPAPHTGTNSKKMDVVPGGPRVYFYDTNDIVSDTLKSGKSWEQVSRRSTGPPLTDP